MGAFTTFSTLVFETQTLMRDSQWLLAAGNYLGQTVLGLVLLFVGMALGKWL
jgi:CrcB protein